MNDKLLKIIQKKTRVSIERITPESNFVEDLGADSLDLIELVMAIEDEYDIEIPDETMDQLKTVQDLTSYLKTRLPNFQ